MCHDYVCFSLNGQISFNKMKKAHLLKLGPRAAKWRGWGRRQEDCKFKASLDSIVRLWIKNKRKPSLCFWCPKFLCRVKLACQGFNIFFMLCSSPGDSFSHTYTSFEDVCIFTSFPQKHCFTGHRTIGWHSFPPLSAPLEFHPSFFIGCRCSNPEAHQHFLLFSTASPCFPAGYFAESIRLSTPSQSSPLWIDVSRSLYHSLPILLGSVDWYFHQLWKFLVVTHSHLHTDPPPPTNIPLHCLY